MLLQVIENPENFIDLKVIIMAVFALAEGVVRLTPSEKDNSIVNKIVSIGTYLLDFILPNRSKRGKKFRMKGNEE
jgi:hypothetical protein